MVILQAFSMSFAGLSHSGDQPSRATFIASRLEKERSWYRTTLQNRKQWITMVFHTDFHGKIWKTMKKAAFLWLKSQLCESNQHFGSKTLCGPGRSCCARWGPNPGGFDSAMRILAEFMEWVWNLPSGYFLHSHGKWPFIDGLPIKNGDFPWLC
jgi:hypothetical protein